EGNERSRCALILVAVGFRAEADVIADEPDAARDLAGDEGVRVRRAAARMIVAGDAACADRRAEDRAGVVARAGARHEIQRLVIAERAPALCQLPRQFVE